MKIGIYLLASVALTSFLSSQVKFGRDIFKDLMALEKSVKKNTQDKSHLDIGSLELFENIAYVMAKHGDASVPDSPEEWLDQFSTFSIYQILPELIELWGVNLKTAEKPKKSKTYRKTYDDIFVFTSSRRVGAFNF